MSALPRAMQAVVCHGPQDYRLEEVPTPRAGAEEGCCQNLCIGGLRQRLEMLSGCAVILGR